MPQWKGIVVSENVSIERRRSERPDLLFFSCPLYSSSSSSIPLYPTLTTLFLLIKELLPEAALTLPSRSNSYGNRGCASEDVAFSQRPPRSWNWQWPTNCQSLRHQPEILHTQLIARIVLKHAHTHTLALQSSDFGQIRWYTRSGTRKRTFNSLPGFSALWGSSLLRDSSERPDYGCKVLGFFGGFKESSFMATSCKRFGG